MFSRRISHLELKDAELWGFYTLSCPKSVLLTSCTWFSGRTRRVNGFRNWLHSSKVGDLVPLEKLHALQK
jgi:hypothetical protein